MSAVATILIPGITGTKLINTNRPNWDTVWSGMQREFEDLNDLAITYKSSLTGMYYDEEPDVIIKPGEIEGLAYSDFLRGLRTKDPVYLFNYDWRLSSGYNGSLLNDFIEYLIEKSKSSLKMEPITNFNIVTHSLGNYVLRSYLHSHGFNVINKIVFVTPPFLGSIDIVSAAIAGRGWFNKSAIRKLVRSIPGALELLPHYNGSSKYDNNENHSFFEFENWQSNITNPNDPDNAKIAAKMRHVLNDANSYIQTNLLDLKSISSDYKKRILVIARHGYETWQSVQVNSQPNTDNIVNFIDFKDSLKNDNGDGKVPHISSCCYADHSILTLMLDDSIWHRDYDHGFILKDERTQKLVNRFLFGNSHFKYNIPGGSVKRVKKLKPKQQKMKSGIQLPYWVADLV